MAAARRRPASNAYKFQLAVLGERKVGKTSFINRLISGDFDEAYQRTIVHQAYDLKKFTLSGEIAFEIFDTIGIPSWDGKLKNLPVKPDAAIIMYDLTSRITAKNVPHWIRELNDMNAVSVIVGNKADVRRPGAPVDLARRTQFYEISVKNNENVESSLLYIARRLLNEPTVEFVSQDFLQQPSASKRKKNDIEDALGAMHI